MNTIPSTAAKSTRSHMGGAFQMSTRLPHEAEALKSHGIAFVRMEYEGRFGDTEIRFTCEDEHEAVVAPPSAQVEAEIRVFFAELLELRFPGWDTAEGSRGAFEWTVALDTLDHRHEVPITEWRSVLISND